MALFCSRKLTSFSPLPHAPPQTNFNTVLTREKMKKEQVIKELTESLRKVRQQQETDKGRSTTPTLWGPCLRYTLGYEGPSTLPKEWWWWWSGPCLK